MRHAVRDIARGLTPEEQQAEQQTARDLLSARAQLRAERGMPRPDPARLARLDRQLASLTLARRRQQGDIYARLPALRRLRGLDPAPRAEDARSLLPDAHAIALEYVASHDRLLILAITPGKTGVNVSSTIVPFNRREFAGSVARALEPGALRDAEEWISRSGPLAAALLAPVADRLVDRDWIVVLPDGLLWKIPFEALRVGDADLAALASVTYATSLATWIQQAALSPAESGALAAIAGPELSSRLRARLALTLPGWSPPDAANAIDQMRTIADMYESRARAWSGRDATEAAVRVAVDAADVIHLAAPLHVTGASPLFSTVLLADGDSTPASDGRWEVREWFASAGRARVVVLPDGRSFGAAGAGAAMDTLAWAAAAAGIPALVIGRWPAEGFDQSDVIVEMYDWLAHMERLTAFEAWGAAVAAVHATERPPSAWAGLRFIGAR